MRFVIFQLVSLLLEGVLNLQIWIMQLPNTTHSHKSRAYHKRVHQDMPQKMILFDDLGKLFHIAVQDI